MRARTLFALTLALATLAPLAVHANYPGEPEPEIYASRFISMPTIYPNAPYGTFQTALRTGDMPTFQVAVHSNYSPEPEVSADLSSLGFPPFALASTTWLGYSDMLHYPGYWHNFPLPSPIGADITDGVKDIFMTAIDGQGNVGTANAHVTIDNVPPTVLLSSIAFSTTSPAQGDVMYLSGHASGTGSAVRFSKAAETLLDASGALMPDAFKGVHTEYGPTSLNEALASSTDGSFTNVSITLFEGGDIGKIARATFFKLALFVYDEAGNTASTSITVPVPHAATTTATSTPPGISSVLFIPATEASRLYERGALGIERGLWEPSASSDIPELAMNADGTSVRQVYTKDIIDTIYGFSGPVGHLIPANLEVYSSFERYMDSLVASSTVGMREWRAYPYDWRYDPRDVVENGTLTKVGDGTLQQIYLEDVIEEMVSSSATGRVTVVAHSNGGLVAKALINKLVAEGKAGMVDQLITIGTPAWGTPVDIGAMLHGDGQNNGFGFITYAPEVRAAAATMPGPYALLPSSAYFSHIAGPVATFASGGMSTPFHNTFPSGISSATDLASFATDAYGLDVLITDPNALNVPYRLSSALVEKAATFHDTFDDWTPPAGLKVTSIAGWGQLTTYRYDYAEHVGHTLCFDILQGFNCKKQPAFVHVPRKTEDGDDTVVSPSATGGGGDVWYFNAQRFNDDDRGNIIHQDITSASPIQNSILDLLEGKSIVEDYIGNIKPVGKGTPLTIIGAESPVNILVTDTAGNETGIVPIPGKSGLYFAKHDIPGSAVDISGENKFITLPAGAAYSVVATGYASGPATLFTESLDAAGAVTASTTLSDIPVATSTTVTFSLGSGGALSPATVDLDGNGSVDTIVTPLPGGTTSFATAESSLDYIRYMTTVINEMPLDAKVRRHLGAKLANVAHLIKKDAKWESADDDGPEQSVRGEELDARIAKKLGKMAVYINKQKDKDNAQKGIPAALGAQILDMLTVLRSLTFNL